VAARFAMPAAEDVQVVARGASQHNAYSLGAALGAGGGVVRHWVQWVISVGMKSPFGWWCQT
jgi:hypothetical protein